MAPFPHVETVAAGRKGMRYTATYAAARVAEAEDQNHDGDEDEQTSAETMENAAMVSRDVSVQNWAAEEEDDGSSHTGEKIVLGALAPSQQCWTGEHNSAANMCPSTCLHLPRTWRADRLAKGSDDGTFVVLPRVLTGIDVAMIGGLLQQYRSIPIEDRAGSLQRRAYRIEALLLRQDARLYAKLIELIRCVDAGIWRSTERLSKCIRSLSWSSTSSVSSSQRRSLTGTSTVVPS